MVRVRNAVGRSGESRGVACGTSDLRSSLDFFCTSGGSGREAHKVRGEAHGIHQHTHLHRGRRRRRARFRLRRFPSHVRRPPPTALGARLRRLLTEPHRRAAAPCRRAVCEPSSFRPGAPLMLRSVIALDISIAGGSRDRPIARKRTFDARTLYTAPPFGTFALMPLALAARLCRPAAAFACARPPSLFIAAMPRVCAASLRHSCTKFTH